MTDDVDPLPEETDTPRQQDCVKTEVSLTETGGSMNETATGTIGTDLGRSERETDSWMHVDKGKCLGVTELSLSEKSCKFHGYGKVYYDYSETCSEREVLFISTFYCVVRCS